MKIGVVQARPVKGDIQANIFNHGKIIDLASLHSADAIFFPELSLTGYEPTLADKLATQLDDQIFDVLQKLSDHKNIVIGVGMPTRSRFGNLISMIIFRPYDTRQIYSKQYLHPDELSYFANGHSQLFLNVQGYKIAPAICYELSLPQHSGNAFDNGAKIYLASVAKTLNGVEKAVETLSGIAKKYSMITLMSNCVGFCDGAECAGKTSAWSNQGVLLGQLGSTSEGMLIIDTDTHELIQKLFE